MRGCSSRIQLYLFPLDPMMVFSDAAWLSWELGGFIGFEQVDLVTGWWVVDVAVVKVDQ